MDSPDTKVKAAGASAAAAIVVVWIAGQAGLDMPPEVGAGIATLLAFVGGYFKKETK